MVQVEMSKDIRDYSPKIISVFDKKQLLCVAISLVYGGPFLLYAKSIPIETRATIALLLMAPVLACGWIRLYDMPFEVFVKHMIVTQVLTPVKRKYKTKNTLDGMDGHKKKKKTRKTWQEMRKAKADMKKYGGIK